MVPIHLREISNDGVLLPGDVAAELYAARLERGVDLRAVSAELRIKYDYLLAIEEGRFADLPGPAYVIGFLRSYAGYLNLDADLLVQRFKAETTEFEPRQDLNSLEPYDEGGVPTGALILLALTLVVGAYGGWYYVVNLDEVAIERVPEVPERMIAALTPAPEAAPVVSPEAEPEPETAPEPALSSEPVQSEPAPEVMPEVMPEPGETGAETAPAMPADEAGEPVITARETIAPVTTAPALPVVLSEEPFDAILASAIEQEPASETVPEAAPVSVMETAPEPETMEPIAEIAEALPEPEPVLAVASAPEPIAETLSEQPEPMAAAALTPEPAVETPPAETEPEPTPAELNEAEPLAATPLETASLQPVIPPPMIVPTDYLPREFGQANIGSIITLRAREESWVQVTGINNELLLTRILRPGDIYHVPNRAGLMLMTGNAGGIEILVDGKLTPPLGQIGKVRRRVALDPVKLLAGTANEP